MPLRDQSRASASSRNDLIVLGLREIAVVSADRIERLGRGQADDIVAIAGQIGEGVGRRDRHGQHQAGRTQARDAAQRRPDRAAGRDPVIDDDRGAAFDRDGGPVSEIAPPPSLDLGQLAPLLVFDIAWRRPDLANNLVVQHEMRLAAVDDRAESRARDGPARRSCARSARRAARPAPSRPRSRPARRRAAGPARPDRCPG